MRSTYLRDRLHLCLRIVASSCLLWSGAWIAPAAAQTLPSFDRFPADAPSRLARAVDDRVHHFAGSLGAAELLAVASGESDRPELRRGLWQSIEGALDAAHGPRLPGAASASAGPATLIGLLDHAIGAYMTELGHIALEMDQQGGIDAVSRLAPLHPGEQGGGSIEVGTVGAFRQLRIHFRGEIAHPDGRAPAVAALFYLLPAASGPPIPGRLLIPTAGAMPSFRAEVATASGKRETRDYGWRPRLTALGSILELNIDGKWARVENEVDAVPQRRIARDPLGFCDATCVDR